MSDPFKNQKGSLISFCLPESVIQFFKQNVVRTPLLVFITIVCIGVICVIIHDFKVFSKTEKSTASSESKTV